MVENVIRHIGGIGAFGVFSICLFFLFFTVMCFWALSVKKAYLTSMSGLPLDGDSTVQNRPTRTETFREQSHE